MFDKHKILHPVYLVQQFKLGVHRSLETSVTLVISVAARPSREYSDARPTVAVTAVPIRRLLLDSPGPQHECPIYSTAATFSFDCLRASSPGRQVTPNSILVYRARSLTHKPRMCTSHLRQPGSLLHDIPPCNLRFTTFISIITLH